MDFTTIRSDKKINSRLAKMTGVNSAIVPGDDEAVRRKKPQMPRSTYSPPC